MAGRQGPSERRSRPRLRERKGPAAVAVGRIAPTGRTAPTAPCRHKMSYIFVISEVVFEDTKI